MKYDDFLTTFQASTVSLKSAWTKLHCGVWVTFNQYRVNKNVSEMQWILHMRTIFIFSFFFFFLFFFFLVGSTDLIPHYSFEKMINVMMYHLSKPQFAHWHWQWRDWQWRVVHNIYSKNMKVVSTSFNNTQTKVLKTLRKKL